MTGVEGPFAVSVTWSGSPSGDGIAVYAVTIAGHVPSSANMREHWRARAKRVKEQRTVALAAVRSTVRFPIPAPWRVRLTRISPKPLDSDNCAFSLKAQRDGVADAFGVADNDPRFTWEYAQERGKPGLRIQIQGGEGA